MFADVWSLLFDQYTIATWVVGAIIGAPLGYYVAAFLWRRSHG